MAVLIHRPHQLRLRRFHLTRSLLRDYRFVLSAAGAALIIGVGLTAIIWRLPVRQQLHALVNTTAYQLATSGDHTSWHTYTDRTDHFQIDVPCFAYTAPQARTSSSPLGTLSLRTTACLYSAGSADEGFEVDAAPATYPADAAGQAALLQQLAVTRDGADAQLTPTTLGNATALSEPLSGHTGQKMYALGAGNLYIITYTRPATAPDLAAQFLSTFHTVD